jgi:hypothetical protein
VVRKLVDGLGEHAALIDVLEAIQRAIRVESIYGHIDH